jgi:hypothetical protein
MIPVGFGAASSSDAALSSYSDALETSDWPSARSFSSRTSLPRLWQYQNTKRSTAKR